EFCTHLRGAWRRDATAPRRRPMRRRSVVDRATHFRNGNHSPGRHETPAGACGRRPGARCQSRTRTLVGVRTRSAGRSAAIAGRDRSSMGLRAEQAKDGCGRLITSLSSWNDLKTFSPPRCLAADYQSLPQSLALSKRYLSGASLLRPSAIIQNVQVTTDLTHFSHVMCDEKEWNAGSLLRRFYSHEQARWGLRANRR